MKTISLMLLVIALAIPVKRTKGFLNPIGNEKQYYPLNGVMMGSDYVWGEIKKP